MAKAVPSDLTDLGFAAEQFGSPDDWSTAESGYLARVIAGVAVEVEAEVGTAVYAAADGLTLARIERAERELASAELWRRLEQFERSAAVRRGENAETIGSRALKNADEAEARGWEAVARVTGVSREGSVAVGAVESGHYDSVVTA